VLQVTHEDLALFLQGYTQKLAIDSGGIGPGVPASVLAQQCAKRLVKTPRLYFLDTGCVLA
jgi:hypothetical protein